MLGFLVMRATYLSLFLGRIFYPCIYILPIPTNHNHEKPWLFEDDYQYTDSDPSKDWWEKWWRMIVWNVKVDALHHFDFFMSMSLIETVGNILGEMADFPYSPCYKAG